MTKIIVNKNRKEQPKFTPVADMSLGDCFIDEDGDLMMKMELYGENVLFLTERCKIRNTGSYQVLKELHITTITGEQDHD